MQSLFLEALLVVLEEPRVQRRPILHDHLDWPSIRPHLLEQGTKDVSPYLNIHFQQA